MRTFRSILRASALALCAFLAVPFAFADESGATGDPLS